MFIFKVMVVYVLILAICEIFKIPTGIVFMLGYAYGIFVGAWLIPEKNARERNNV
jgi:hypothetical protein